MLTIRFQRIGRKNDPAFRIVVSEKARHPQAGNPLQVVGSYNPKTKHTIIDEERVKHWLSKGAQASGTVNNLLITKGIVEGKKTNVRGQKVEPKEKEPAPAEKAPEAKAEAPAEEKAEVAAEPKEEQMTTESSVEPSA